MSDDAPAHRLGLALCRLGSALVGTLTLATAAWATPPDKSRLDLVDPFLGTSGDGNVFPGVSLPFGFIQVSPDTGPGSGAAGYKFHKPIRGFSQQHISGMGGPLYGHIALLPITGDLGQPSQLVSSGKSEEAAGPGYYQVRLAPWDVKVALTATRHVALHRHTFPVHAESRVVINVGHVLYGTEKSWSSAQPVGGELRVDAARREVTGHMTYQGARSSKRSWKVYFVAQLDTAPESFGSWDDSGKPQGGSGAVNGKEIGAYLNFKTTAGQVVHSKLALSYQSLEQARSYIQQEAPGWDFNAAHAQAREVWKTALDTISVEGGSEDQQRQFYTALYRLHLTPNDWSRERPARYDDQPYYENILCLWDTFRTVNPLLTLIQPKVQADIVNTLLNYYRFDGWTGDAHSAYHFEHVQNGSSADVVMADAYVKKLPGIDWKLAYQAIRKNAFVDHNPEADYRPEHGRFRLDDYRRYGYVPTDISSYRAVQGVSRTLEYVHNDASVLTLAREFGSAADVAELERRQLWYRHLWDPSVSFMRGKRRDGSWHTPFDPVKEETGPQYYEGHAWTWSWHVPHDVQGLINLLGGNRPFVDKLSRAVEHHYEAYNEPGMLQTFMFVHAGRPDLTQYYSRKALSYFSSRTDGLPGNDDSATTSAWLIWAMLGIYPNAGQDYYYIGSPSFTKATLKLGNGRELVIKAPAASVDNKYVGAARLDGKTWPQAWLRHQHISAGAELHLQMQSRPGGWGAYRPPPSISSPTQ
ncbi:GH92 family glycosyl hydrolase [Paucibacter sp. M5-1]|uniref:GH92 family glycosyl hydrolase n=1 Tax=Paucibacter sp. M5-1 TaxID=3015998 RepID=UPI0022B93094|nr:GH92 family glycosyl hydrolase [Paucibacter sp. M5-1]MCZ7883057.1 GH92 family glycosyl hydrolase [Paucibacter sp. M5-1]